MNNENWSKEFDELIKAHNMFPPIAELKSFIRKVAEESRREGLKEGERIERGNIVKYLQRERGLAQGVPVKERMGLVEGIEQIGRGITALEHHKTNPEARALSPLDKETGHSEGLYADGCVVAENAGRGHTFMPGCEKYSPKSHPTTSLDNQKEVCKCEKPRFCFDETYPCPNHPNCEECCEKCDDKGEPGYIACKDCPCHLQKTN